MTDLPCDSEPKAIEDLTGGTALRQLIVCSQRYGSSPADRDAYARLLVIYSLRLALHRLDFRDVAGICLRGLERA